MSKYILLKNNGDVEVKELQQALDLKTMYKWIDCQHIDIAESIISAKMGCRVFLIFDEEYLLNYDEPQANKIASLLFGYTIKTNECLCGNVIITKDIDGEMVGFTDAEYNKLKNILKTCKNVAAMTRFVVQKPRLEFIPVKI